jgi:hypothetical protein
MFRQHWLWRVKAISQKFCLIPDSRWFLAWLILRPWKWRRHVPQKHLLTFNGLHGFTFQKTELLKKMHYFSHFWSFVFVTFLCGFDFHRSYIFLATYMLLLFVLYLQIPPLHLLIISLLPSWLSQVKTLSGAKFVYLIRH